MPTQNVDINNRQVTKQRNTRQREIEITGLREDADQAFTQGNYEQALEKYFTAKNLAINIGKHLEASILLASIANTYARMGDYNNAEIYYLKATDKLKNESNGQKLTTQLDKIGVFLG